MGSLVKAIRDTVGVDDQKAIKERMELLLVAAKAKIRGYKDEINENFMNPAQVEKTQIPGIRAIRFIEQYHVASKSSFNQQVGDHLTQAIDSFFSIGGKDTDTKQAVQGGVKALISTALDGFIGGTEAGESEEKIYVVVPENNAFIRADICIWKYHMTDNALSSNSDTAVAYILCKSVIDHTKLTIDELIYFVSDTLASRKNIPSVDVSIDVAIPNPDVAARGTTPTITQPTKMRVMADESGTALMKPGKTAGSKLLDDYYPVMIDGNTQSSTSAPSIGVVEAYIEELIRVWKKLKEDRAITG